MFAATTMHPHHTHPHHTHATKEPIEFETFRYDPHSVSTKPNSDFKTVRSNYNNLVAPLTFKVEKAIATIQTKTVCGRNNTEWTKKCFKTKN